MLAAKHCFVRPEQVINSFLAVYMPLHKLHMTNSEITSEIHVISPQCGKSFVITWCSKIQLNLGRKCNKDKDQFLQALHHSTFVTAKNVSTPWLMKFFDWFRLRFRHLYDFHSRFSLWKSSNITSEGTLTNIIS